MTQYASAEEFAAMLRTGKRPDGSAINADFMPWRAVGQATDQELHSIWLYLRSRPPIARTTRVAR